MRIVKLDKNTGRSVIQASGALRAGGVIIYPTDTLYGLGADAFSEEAVAKIYSIKGRDTEKPLHCVVSDLEMAAEYVELNDVARKLADEFLPGPLTIILKKRAGLNTGIARGIDSIGIRIPNNDFCTELAKAFGRPYTATSANKAGAENVLSIAEINAQLGEAMNAIDLVIDAGTLPMSLPSTVVNLYSGSPVILRAGAISVDEIQRVTS